MKQAILAKRTIGMLAALSALLAACGGAPSEQPVAVPKDIVVTVRVADAEEYRIRLTDADDIEHSVRLLGPARQRVFLAIGRKEVGAFAVAPQHDYLIRSVDPVEPPLDVPRAAYIVARGPFSEDDERALLKQHRIEVVVAKNSGGKATKGKIAAARALGIKVVMLRRPALPDVPTADTVQDAVAWLDHVPAPSADRGV